MFTNVPRRSGASKLVFDRGQLGLVFRSVPHPDLFQAGERQKRREIAVLDSGASPCVQALEKGQFAHGRNRWDASAVADAEVAQLGEPAQYVDVIDVGA